MLSCLLLLLSAEPLTLNDGDRVVFLGNTLIEREQHYGWWELALTARFADKKVAFRNLGWDGDTVFGQGRVGYGSATSAGTATPSSARAASATPTRAPGRRGWTWRTSTWSITRCR
jgi:hypothetical protein